MAKRTRRGERFRLMIYERMWQRWAFPSVLIILASFALWWFAPLIEIIPRRLDALALLPAPVALLILLYAFLARRLAWVRCESRRLRIQTPFYPLLVSYGRIREVRPQTFADIFDPSQEKAARRNWLRPYWRQTALVVDLKSFPLNKTWLRLWLSPYLIHPTDTALVLLVEDWMGLSRQLDDRTTAYDMARAERRQRDLERRSY